MRRPRHKLSVSTFPFLAVLLSAMGALILLLFVMDRRAKFVARVKLQEARDARVTGVTAKMAAEEARLEAEWQRERDRLHALLLEQDGELQAQMQAVLGKLSAAEKDADRQHQKIQALQTSLKDETVRLEKAAAGLAQLRSGLDQTARNEGASRSELTKWTRDLVQLERTLNDLRRIKGEESQTYSLIPYRGKLGEGRRPIYVECCSRGLVFHPEQTVIAHPHKDGLRIREEVNQRGIMLVREKPAKAGRPLPHTESTNPYVLFLVRPDGIGAYYDGMAALAGFDINFGYELIDADWTLDFEETNVARTKTLTPNPSPPHRESAQLGLPNGGEEGTNLPFPPPSGTGARASTTTSENGGRGDGGGASFAPGRRTANQPLSQSPSPLGLALFPSEREGRSVLHVLPLVTVAAPFSGSMGVGGIASALPPNGYGRGGAGGPARTGVEPLAVEVGPPLGQPSIGEEIRLPNGVQSGGTPPVFSRAQPVSPLRPPGGSDAHATNPSRGGQDHGQGSSALTPPPGVTLLPSNKEGDTPDSANSQKSPLRPNGEITWRPSAGGQARTSGVPGQLSQPNDSNEADGREPKKARVAVGGEPGGNGPDDPLARLGQPLAPKAPPKHEPPKATPPIRLVGNRDFVLTVECFDDVAVLYPSGQTFAMKGGNEQAAVDERLIRAVQQLIARRQATVRDGEPRYRPQLRFQVHPDAVRTYFHVYPLLETFRIPMVRENVEN